MNVNLHIHTFYSYNAYGWSPHQIALECYKAGLEVAGIIDFDVLDGMIEFYDACDQLGLKGTVGLETRTFNDRISDKEIDSPGEPGVSYVAGTGFTRIPALHSAEEDFLRMLSETSRRRNLALIQRINQAFPDLSIDYEKDVIPLTPSGNATERHIVEAYITLSYQRYPDRHNTVWSSVLDLPKADVVKLLNDRPAFEEVVRRKLAKRGGIGYLQPSEETFPTTKDTFAWMKNCGAIPTESWLDGTSDGEQDPNELLEMSYEMGARALNIIPDRNWNLKDKEIREMKVKNLRAVVQTAKRMHMPLHIGTEMNKQGQPLFDDLKGDVLSEFKKDFIKGAHIIIGHVILSRFANYGYQSPAAESDFRDIHKKNGFFEAVGRLPALKTSQVKALLDQTEDKAFGCIMDASKKVKWAI
jgi:hypothetical protein